MAETPKPELQLFHRLADAASASVRRKVVDLGLEDAVEFRNVSFDSHAQALAALGSEETPALWDGSKLHVGASECLAWLEQRVRHGGSRAP